MEKEFTNGHQGKHMTVNGIVDAKKDTVYGEAKMVTHISENGKTLKLMVTVCIHGHQAINMKVNGRNA